MAVHDNRFLTDNRLSLTGKSGKSRLPDNALSRSDVVCSRGRARDRHRLYIPPCPVDRRGLGSVGMIERIQVATTAYFLTIAVVCGKIGATVTFPFLAPTLIFLLSTSA